ncbi:CGNR zinc finger domain-containing protein [Saccharothrix variisporea]|uniref:Putative stress-induced transcription regulator n=1 Tax=Saccharothrix variisporea TaxID=543527 RepID=A0A495X7Q1_9PSEU|nr:CGNR zinc finger domain-containing protein [Saccharothrix variisporea]RKT67548.1 putative stress-induced transcription regulator [Saccharothrix variisporea]
MLADALRAHDWPERPLDDQPLGTDLLNTRWITGTTWYDVLDHDDLTRAWLTDHGLPADPVPRAELAQTRAAIAAAIADPTTLDALDPLLAHGRLRLTVDAEHPDVADPRWHAPWVCLRDFLRLRAEHPDRIRKCANPDCVLHFVDTSRTGRRQWCSMTVCGNRLKARRHHDRQRARA